MTIRFLSDSVIVTINAGIACIFIARKLAVEVH